MRINISKILLPVCAILAMLLLSACNMPSNVAGTSPTLDVTQAYQTVQAKLTEAAGLTPSNTPGQIPTDSGLTTPTATTQLATAAPTSPPASPTASIACDRATAGSPIDVTIPDDTRMAPGQLFTKIWRLQNVGSCTWSSAYAITFFSGEQMSAPASVPLAGNVAPGQSVDIAVDMIAPQKAGTYQSNWKLRNAANVLFGIGPDGSAPFWVRIEVLVTPTPSPTAPSPTPTRTLTPTTAATPSPKASGTVTLIPGNTVDLDSGQVNAGGQDLLFANSDDGQHVLTWQNGAQGSVYGSSAPTPGTCQNAALTGNQLIVENISAGSYLCYRTDGGSYGRTRLATFEASTGNLTLEFLTWSTP